MLKPRLIPVITLDNGAMVKTIQFSNPIYIGDPVNAARMFSEKHADELIVLDIKAAHSGHKPDLNLLRSIAEECRMPLCYGGGITTIQQIKNILKAGVEKVALNTSAALNPRFVSSAVEEFGSSSIVLSIDVRKTLAGDYQVYTHGGSRLHQHDAIDYARDMEQHGIGEILLTSIDRDGTYSGYDLDLINGLSKAVDVPLIACGGAGELYDCALAVQQGAAAVAAGSLFTFKGRHHAVLISYPTYSQWDTLLNRVINA